MRPATLILLSLAALAGAFFGVRQYAPQYLPDRFTTDAMLRERFRERIAAENVGAAAFFAKFETLFPADNEALMSELIALYRRGGTEQQARVLGESYMTSFVEDNKHYIARAEPAALTSLASTLREGARALRRENPAACMASLSGGPIPSASGAPSPALTSAAVAMLDTIASGRNQATRYEAPTEQQLIAWLDRYASLGGDRAVLEAFENTALLSRFEPDALCEASELMWTAALQAEDDFVPRFVSMAMSQ
jgi:hypothetical protein